MNRLSVLSLLLAGVAWAGGGGTGGGGTGGGGGVPFAGYEVRISSETAPPGGIAQIKVSLTDPEPIVTGSTGVKFDSSVVDSILGISVFSAAGDAVGTATYSNGQLSFQLRSPLGSLGMLPVGYPFLSIAVAIRPSAKPGTTVPVTLDLTNTTITNPLGQSVPVLTKPGSLTVGGLMDVDNVLPGGGWIPAGQPVRVIGRGFNSSAKVRLEGQASAVATVVSANEIDIVSPVPYLLDGSAIRVRVGGEQKDYYSYPRAQVIATGSTLAGVVPLFSWHAPRLMQVSYSPSADAAALALQNAQTSPVKVTVAAPLAWNASPVSLDLPAGTRMTQDLAQLFPGATAAQLTDIRVYCSSGVSVVGLQRATPLSPVAALPPLVLQVGSY